MSALALNIYQINGKHKYILIQTVTAKLYFELTGEEHYLNINFTIYNCEENECSVLYIMQDGLQHS